MALIEGHNKTYGDSEPEEDAEPKQVRSGANHAPASLDQLGALGINVQKAGA